MASQDFELHETQICGLIRGSELPVALALLEQYTSLLRNTYELLGDDLAAALLLSELIQRAAAGRVIGDWLTNRDVAASPPSRFTSVNSLATVTGIPRETVRRKIELLVKKGWVVRNERGAVRVTAASASNFIHLKQTSSYAAGTLRCARELTELLNRKRRRQPRASTLKSG